MNAVLFGTVFVRVTRAQRRGLSIIFSKNACIREIRGRIFLFIRVVEAKHSNTIQCTSSLWSVRQNKRTGQRFEMHHLRTIHPDDTLQKPMVLCTPNAIVHEIDRWSPLCPPHPDSYTDRGDGSGLDQHQFDDAERYRFPSTINRYADLSNGALPGWMCRVCGESYSNEQLLRRHVAYQVHDELGNVTQGDPLGCPLHPDVTVTSEAELHSLYKNVAIEELEKASLRAGARIRHYHAYDCRGEPRNGSKHNGPRPPTLAEVKAWVAESLPEVICTVTPTDVATGSSFDASYSYTPDEIVWEKHFTDCVSAENDGTCVVDFEKFHETESDVPGAVERVSWH